MTKPQQLQTKPYIAREKNILRFFQKYNTLSREGKERIACFIDGRPHSWNYVCWQFSNGTALSRRMLAQIVRNGFRSMEED